jgi:hypothetical protein
MSVKRSRVVLDGDDRGEPTMPIPAMRLFRIEVELDQTSDLLFVCDRVEAPDDNVAVHVASYTIRSVIRPPHFISRFRVTEVEREPQIAPPRNEEMVS